MYMIRSWNRNRSQNRNRIQIKCRNRNRLQIFRFRNPAFSSWLAGWKILWKKMVLCPSTRLLHLGFIRTPWQCVTISHLRSGTLSASPSSLCSHPWQPSSLDITNTLGRVSSLHSSVVRVCSRSLQYQLGQFVYQSGRSSSSPQPQQRRAPLSLAPGFPWPHHSHSPGCLASHLLSSGGSSSGGHLC